ncbi:MAG: DUF4330 domain-containing protein [Oscillospiraceae bacterium]
MEKKETKRLGKLNIIDLLVLLLAVALLAFVGYKLATRGNGGGAANRIGITYTVKCEGVDSALYETAQTYIPSTVMAAGVRYDVEITGVEKEPFLVVTSNGTWVEDPDHVNLIFTLQGTVANNDVITSDVGGQEVRIGKSDYIVKSEYLEFGSGIVTSATWDKPAA